MKKEDSKFGYIGVVFGMLIILKLCGILDWSWLLILTSPLWIEAIVIIVVFVIIVGTIIFITD